MARKRGIDKQVLRVLLRLYLVFGAILLGFVIALNVQAVHNHVVAPWTSFVTHSASLLMNIFGASSWVVENYLSTSSYAINVVDGCNGIYATAILISGILAYPSSWREKALGLLLGVAAIFGLNLVRVISLFYLGEHYPDVFHEAHVYVWQPIIIVWAIFVWDFWSRKIKPSK
ncbi:MAG: exosortase H [candidate division Zixibacteria bacterium]|nr:exosortase H [candidate division Zixibacteria bacterium]